MPSRLAMPSRRTGRTPTYGYSAAAIVLLTVLAFRAPDIQAWLWWALMGAGGR